MTLLYEMRKRARQVVGPVLAISVFGYFAYHSVQGDRGLIAWLQLGQQVEIAQATLEKVSRERAALEHRARLLRPDNLDPDMLDERARQVLSLTRPDELVIFEKDRDVIREPMRGREAPTEATAPVIQDSSAKPALSILIPSAHAAAR